MMNGFTCGAFDLLHAGHVHFLHACRDRCDALLVGLHATPQIDRATKNAPVQTLYERWLQLAALSCVTRIVPYETEADLENLLAIEPIDVRFLGSDYASHQQYTGKTLCETRGITVQFIPRLHTFSSTELRQRVWAREWKQH